MSTLALSGGPLDEAPADGWAHGEERAFPDPANPNLEVGYRRLSKDVLTDEDPMQAVYIGVRRAGTTVWNPHLQPAG